MSDHIDITEAGEPIREIDVALSYRIVELFSEGLYRSANKTFEELVSNSFDAGAKQVEVILPVDLSAIDAEIAVFDDGSAMDDGGLELLWQIGESNKREARGKAHGRRQIGKFGIGKLATYLLGNLLTYVCRYDGVFYAVTMDYRDLDTSAKTGVAPQKDPLKLSVRKLDENETRAALEHWIDGDKLEKSGMRLFGPKAIDSWTCAILSDLKPKASEIEPGRLKWVLSTAMPIRDDFSIWLDGEKLKPSRLKGKLKRWTLGKEMKEFVVPTDIELRPDKHRKKSDEKHYGILLPGLGRIAGYAEGYGDTLTKGRAAERGRSHGFFIYVLDRLVNVDDEYFGIDPNLLSHGIFNRFRCVLHVDGLDDILRSTRETVAAGPGLARLHELLKAIFNFVRKQIQDSDVEIDPGSRISDRLSGSPASLSRRPIVELVRCALRGQVSPKFVRVPMDLPDDEQEIILEALEKRAEADEKFIEEVKVSYALSSLNGIAVYDAEDFSLNINGLHPFVGAFLDDYLNQNENPVGLLAMAEILLESMLYRMGYKRNAVEDILNERDELLRYLAKSSGKRSAAIVSEDLRDARNKQSELEDELVAVFDKLGFDATKIGGNNKPDGMASAHLSADEEGTPQRYSLSLEAKSKKKDGEKVAAKSVGISTVARHRDDYDCEHAVVVGPAFPTSQKEGSALAKEIKSEADKYKDEPDSKKRTITLITIDDLARLVRSAAQKQIGPSKMRSLFQTCSLPEESRSWIDEALSVKVNSPPYAELLECVFAEQQEDPSEVVTYDALRVALRNAHSIKNSTEVIKEMCKSLAAIVPSMVKARDKSVEIEVAPDIILAAVKAASQADIRKKKRDS